MSSDCRGGFFGASEHDSLTSYGHIQGMLDRDQRTAKLRCRREEDAADSRMYQWSIMNDCTYPYSCCRKNTTKHLSDTFRPSWYYFCSKNRRTSRITRTKAYLRRAFQRLKQALIVSVYLLGFVSVPCSLTAPTVRGNNNVMVDNDRMHSTPKWVNPCNIRHDEETTFAGEAVPNVDLVTQIVHQARIASNYAEQFKEEFAQTMFNTPFEKLHQSWTHVNFNWLPTKEQIPKSLGVPLSNQYLESVEDEILLDAYENLQRIAVGLEQVVWDQEDEQGPFADRFMQAEYNLRALLCEIQTAIYERGLEMRPDVTRDIMAPDERNNENNTKTSKNLRALIVYRDYMNALEYVIESFTHLKSKV
ncbi:uncharacterized protein LOC108739408 isoform X2 [Agrilus planipennis]|uniref:Uncharacterized protein LOC108739408 isoform X2 n=1 Tax=Agrilus planipennis TaxID=224129 RepID=A0A1W4X7I7_AGRPL|nr:uncharacterized protein LOC108739408 isoform X2 [Agrilus planipennis]